MLCCCFENNIILNMADKEFEEFTDCLDDLPQHFKASDQSYK